MVIERGYAEVGFSAVHRMDRLDWWDLLVSFPDAARVEINADHAELPLFVDRFDVSSAFNESVPNQQILDLFGEPTEFHLRVRFDTTEMVADERVCGPGWNERDLPSQATFLAQLTMNSSAKGRHGAVFSGYRPDWWIGHYHDGSKALNGGELYLLEREFVFPGEVTRVAIRPTDPEQWTHVAEGSHIEMREGARLTGIARVTGRRP